MATAGKDTTTADGLLVVTRLPGRQWPLLVAGAIMVGVPLARVIDGEGGLAPPTATSFFMATIGLLVLFNWLLLRAVDEQLRKGLKDHAQEPDGPVVSVHPTWILRRRQPALGMFVTDRGAPLGWLPTVGLHPAFEPRAPFSLVGVAAPRRASLLRSRPVGQAIVGAIEPPDPAAHEPHPLATRAEELMGWIAPSDATLRGADGFEPAPPAPTARPGPIDPAVLRSAEATRARLRTADHITNVVSIVAIVALTGNASGTAGLVLAASMVAISVASRPLRGWAEKPLCDQLTATTGLPPTDVRTLSRMLLAAGLGQVSAGPPS